MLKTSGLVLDVHDDIGGEVLRSLFPSPNDLPGVVKEAHALSSEERQLLPDDDYALVLVNGDQKLRKYACHDAGNTVLSVLYFVKTGHKLPEEAQKVAAANLLKACSWYSLDAPEELAKVAMGIGTGLAILQAPAAYKNTKGNLQANMAGIREHEARGHTVVTPDQMKGKHAEVSGTDLAPASAPAPSVAPSKTVVKKVAFMQPHVDVTGKEASVAVLEKRASRFALEERYPLDSYEQVKRASAYFEEYGGRFVPSDRHEFCSNLIKRAEELGIEVTQRVQKYGSSSYAPADEIKVAMDSRRNILQDDRAHRLLSELEENRPFVPPELFCATLGEFDKVAGINHLYDRDVLDPYFSTYGFEKTAEEDSDWSEVIGNDMVNASELKIFAKGNYALLHNMFGEDMASEFRKDPVGIFKSMPRDQKKVIMRLATDNGADVDTSI